ncbi:MAG TPA: thermonuclease family protein [Flavitalea sp.]|nr:thermonuclease family protein [Flavitalea sp.]
MLLLSSRIFCFLWLTAPLFSCSGKIPVNDNAQETFFKVTRVIDGDTFYIDRDGREERIRLIGIDAPEFRKSARKEIGYFGKEARDYLTKLLKGKKVRLEYDVSRLDQYKRTLAYVYLEDGLFLNALLIEQGYAAALTVPPNVKYSDRFISLERQARKGKKGLWNR